jgi:hypothetical protein
MSNPQIKIGANYYKLTEIYSKTIYARKKVNLYKSYKPGSKPVATIPAGSIVGIVQGFIANGYKGSFTSFFIIGANTRDPNMRLVPYTSDNFSETALAQQGGKSSKDILKEEKQESEPWYIKLTKTALPIIVIGAGAFLLLRKKL